MRPVSYFIGQGLTNGLACLLE